MSIKILDEFSDYEKDVLNEFNRLVRSLGYSYIFSYRERSGLGGFCILKNGDTWVSYIEERGEIDRYREYDDVYDMVLDLFDEIGKKEFCLANFPTKQFFKKKNQVKVLKRNNYYLKGEKNHEKF